jgi:hypothetical protein
MSSLVLWTNNASSLLASGITNTATACTVTAGQGALFPSPGASQYCVATLEDTSGNIEVVWFTNRTTDTFTIVRAQEGTTALTFASGSRFELRVTAGILNLFLQKTGGDTISGTTNMTGVMALGSGGSIQGGEYAGGHIRGNPGETDNQLTVPTGGGAPTIGTSPILTTANIASNMPSGTSLALTNMIVMWAGTSGSIPSGWHLCDGTNGTPDLRDQFIVGGGGALATSGGSNPGSTGSSTVPITIGGYALVAGDLPTLEYDLWGISGQSQQASNWTLGSSSATVAGYQAAGGSFLKQNGGGQTLVQTPNTGGAGGGVANAHTHSVGGSSSHSHSITLPPYKAVFLIMKL